MAVTAILLMVFAVAGYFVFNKIVRTVDYEIHLDGSHLIRSLADDLNTVDQAGNGFSMRVSLPGRLRGYRNYSIQFYQQEPTVFLFATGFSQGNDLWLSAPLGNSRNSTCLIDDCFRCRDVGEVDATVACDKDALHVNETRTVRFARFMDRLYITQDFNLNQTTRTGMLAVPILHYAGSLPPADTWDAITNRAFDLEDKSVVYVYLHQPENPSKPRVLSLVFRTNNSNGVPVPMRVSTRYAPVSQSQTAVVGEPTGQVFTFEKAVKACFAPESGDIGRPWLFLSADQQVIELDRAREVCVTYP